MCRVALSVFLRVCGSLLFFFKQKTAYEMRISDWSSAVCSSDLRFLQDGAHFGLGAAAMDGGPHAKGAVHLFGQVAHCQHCHDSDSLFAFDDCILVSRIHSCKLSWRRRPGHARPRFWVNLCMGDESENFPALSLGRSADRHPFEIGR